MPISPESDYCLIGAQDCLHITPDIAVGAHLGAIDVDALVDACVGEPTRVFEQRLIETVLNWRSSASAFERAALACSTLVYAQNSMQEFLWGITGPIAEQYLYNRGWARRTTIFGGLMPRRDLNVPIPDIHSLRKPYLVDAVFAVEPYLPRYCELLRAQHERLTEALSNVSLPTFGAWFGVTVEAAQERRRLATEQAIMSMPVLKYKPDKRKIRATRKAVRRGMKAMNTLIAPRAYHAFVSNDGLIINGHLFDYRARKKNAFNIIDYTAEVRGVHVPYELSILSKDGVLLGSGCITFNATPMLDQVIALALHVRDQEAELDLIKTCNWGLTPEGLEAKDLIAILPQAPQALVQAAMPYFQNNPDQRRFYSYRKRIMRAIKRDVEHTLSEKTGIQPEVYAFMSRPPCDIEDFATLFTNDHREQFDCTMLATLPQRHTLGYSVW